MKKICINNCKYDEDYLDHCLNYKSGNGEPPSPYEARIRKEWEDSISDEELSEMSHIIDKRIDKTHLVTLHDMAVWDLQAKKMAKTLVEDHGITNIMDFLKFTGQTPSPEDSPNKE